MVIGVVLGLLIGTLAWLDSSYLLNLLLHAIGLPGAVYVFGTVVGLAWCAKLLTQRRSESRHQLALAAWFDGLASGLEKPIGALLSIGVMAQIHASMLSSPMAHLHVVALCLSVSICLALCRFSLNESAEGFREVPPTAKRLTA